MFLVPCACNTWIISALLNIFEGVAHVDVKCVSSRNSEARDKRQTVRCMYCLPVSGIKGFSLCRPRSMWRLCLRPPGISVDKAGSAKPNSISQILQRVLLLLLSAGVRSIGGTFVRYKWQRWGRHQKNPPRISWKGHFHQREKGAGQNPR